MLRVAVRGIRAHLVRFVMSLLAVALGVAFVAGTFSLRTMMSGTFDQIVDATSTADVYVRDASTDVEGSGGAFGAQSPVVPVDLTESIAALDGVAAVVPDVSGSIVLVGADGTAVQTGQAPSIGLGWSPDSTDVSFPSGRAPQGADEIAIERGALERSGLAVGDATRIVVGGEVRDVTVVGEADMGGSMAGATLILLPEDVALAAFAPDGLVPSLGITLADGASSEDVLTEIDGVLADSGTDGLEAVTGEQVAQESKDAIADVLGFVTTFLLVFAAVALFVGAFIIANTFAMSVRQRMREFALLRAVGASPVQVFVSILVQAGIVGVVGAAIGVLGGIGLVVALRAGLDRMGMQLAGEIPADPETLALSVLVGTVVSLAAAAVPARRAALVPPVEAMREEVTVRERSLRTRGWVGLALLVVGAAALAVAVARPSADRAPTWLGVGAGAVLVGMLVVAPVLARTVVGALAWPLVALLRPIGRLARGNVVRSPRRTANTAGALMIGMALVGAATVIAASTQASVADVVAAETDADLVLRSASGTIPEGVVADVEAVPGVEVADVVRYAPATLALPDGTAVGGGPGPSLVAGIAPEMVGRTLLVTVEDGDPTQALAAGEAMVNASLLDGVGVGDALEVTGPSGAPAEVTVGAVIRSTAVGTPVTVSTDALDALAPRQTQVVDTIFLVAEPGTDPATLKTDVSAAVAPYVVVSVLTQEEFVSQLSAQVDQILVILYALLGLSVVIAVLGIVNTLALSVIERTREIGLLRAVGLGRLQLAGTVTIESVLTAVFGTAVGLAVGVGLAATMPTVFEADGLTTLAVPWATLLVMLALAVVVGVLAAVWPAVRAARLRVLDAVSYE